MQGIRVSDDKQLFIQQTPGCIIITDDQRLVYKLHVDGDPDEDDIVDKVYIDVRVSVRPVVVNVFVQHEDEKIDLVDVVIKNVILLDVFYDLLDEIIVEMDFYVVVVLLLLVVFIDVIRMLDNQDLEELPEVIVSRDILTIS